MAHEATLAAGAHHAAPPARRAPGRVRPLLQRLVHGLMQGTADGPPVMAITVLDAQIDRGHVGPRGRARALSGPVGVGGGGPVPGEVMSW